MRALEEWRSRVLREDVQLSVRYQGYQLVGHLDGLS